MAELSDYDIRQIENSIKEFSDTYNKIVKNISKDRFRSGLEKALSRLNTYSKEEQQALKQAEKTIDKMMNGSGFFSSGGLNKILEKKINESQKQIEEIISDYNDTLNSIYNALPKIGVKGTTGFSFDETDYSGDLDTIMTILMSIMAMIPRVSHLARLFQKTRMAKLMKWNRLFLIVLFRYILKHHLCQNLLQTEKQK